MTREIELKYDAERDRFYIDCGTLETARAVLDLITYAYDMLKKSNGAPRVSPAPSEEDIETRE